MSTDARTSCKGSRELRGLRRWAAPWPQAQGSCMGSGSARLPWPCWSSDFVSNFIRSGCNIRTGAGGGDADGQRMALEFDAAGVGGEFGGFRVMGNKMDRDANQWEPTG